MLRLLMPPNASRERRYIADVIFGKFLGLKVEVREHEDTKVVVTDGEHRRLVLDDSFFAGLDIPLLRADKIPTLPLRRWLVAESGLELALIEPDLPVLFGQRFSTDGFVVVGESEIRLGLDVLGSVFFMLTRYEELFSPARDTYDRFPASASLAFKAGFLARPLVNEYVEVLWQCLKRLWRGLARRERTFRVCLSHDVDQPFLLLGNRLSQVVRTVVGDAFKRKTPLRAVKRPLQWVAARVLGPEYDPAYTFGYIMDLAEKHALRSAFYFIPAMGAGPPDYRYGLGEPHIRELMADIHARGHEIGYHASMETYQDRALIQSEVALLQKAREEAGAGETPCGSRQHYLRVRVPLTLRYLAEAGLAYDTTLGYADQAGFRCGTCWEYPLYDLEQRQVLPIIERPLVVMECSVIDGAYMGLGIGEQALKVMLQLAGRCQQFSGDFTLLWHNTRLGLPEERRLLERLLAQLIPA
jgi:hypothetical protein